MVVRSITRTPKEHVCLRKKGSLHIVDGCELTHTHTHTRERERERERERVHISASRVRTHLQTHNQYNSLIICLITWLGTSIATKSLLLHNKQNGQQHLWWVINFAPVTLKQMEQLIKRFTATRSEASLLQIDAFYTSHLYNLALLRTSPIYCIYIYISIKNRPRDGRLPVRV